MSANELKEKIDVINGTVNEFGDVVRIRIDNARDDTYELIDRFSENVDLHISRIEVEITDLTSILVLNAQWHINRAYFHASPGLLAFLAAIVTIAKTIYSIVKFITDSQVFRVLLAIHKIAYTLWPDYKAAVDGILMKLSDASRVLGLGWDGFRHLINAASSGMAIVSSLRGEDTWEMRGSLYEAYEKHSVTIAKQLSLFQTDPGIVFENIFYTGKRDEHGFTGGWLDKITTTMDSNVEMVTKVAENVGKMTTELSMFEQTLPAFIRDNIPQAIWDSIEKADTLINRKLIPGLSVIERKITEIDAVLEAHRKRADDLVNKLAHPGDMLLGVDDLPDYAKRNQLALIDDVTSREFMDRATAERLAMTSDLNEFDIIREALSAPTPEPEFMAFESLERKAVTGIVEEPHETWFVGDF